MISLFYLFFFLLLPPATPIINFSLFRTGQADSTVVCPVDCDHVMSSSALLKHVETCRLRRQDYTDTEIVSSKLLFISVIG